MFQLAREQRLPIFVFDPTQVAFELQNAPELHDAGHLAPAHVGQGLNRLPAGSGKVPLFDKTQRLRPDGVQK